MYSTAKSCTLLTCRLAEVWWFSGNGTKGNYAKRYQIRNALSLRSLQPLFTKLAKSHISAQFFVRVYVSGWYTYFETPQVLFSFCFREKGVKTQIIYESHSWGTFKKIFCVFFVSWRATEIILLFKVDREYFTWQFSNIFFSKIIKDTTTKYGQ